MKKYPEVIALLFLALALGILSKATELRNEPNRLMVLTTTDSRGIDCPLEELRNLRSELREELRSNVRETVRQQMRSVATEIRAAMESVR